MVEPKMMETIEDELRRLEREENVRILYACESGSRAWGFPSKDSDYDVRFLYVRPVEWYLSVFDRRDVIEQPISDLLDISGWDLRKALRLLRKSNPPLLEWLRSPIKYAEFSDAADRLRELSSRAFSPKSGMHHYLNMARGNFREYLQGDVVRIKKYFYVLRPVLACKWVVKFEEVPPLEFQTLVRELIPAESSLHEAIQELLARKMSGEELDYEPKLNVLNDYLDAELRQLEKLAKEAAPADPIYEEELDGLFRDVLAEVWG